MFGISNIRVRTRSRINGLPRDTAWHLGMHRPFYQEARGARILVYHGVCRSDHLLFNTLFVNLKMFESQLRFYKKYFHVISLDDFYQRKFDENKFNLCLSFDDGFANNYQYALPLLEKYRVPATFFITGIRNAGHDILWNDILNIAYRYGPSTLNFRNETFVRGKDYRYISAATGERLVDTLRSGDFGDKAALIDLLTPLKSKAHDEYWLQLTEDEIRKMSASKWVTIGSHGYYHNDLGKIPLPSAKEEMLGSKQYLENLTGKEIKALAFPYGSYSREVVAEAKAIGYSQLLATEFIFPEDAADLALRERLAINPFVSVINQMHATITGNYK